MKRTPTISAVLLQPLVQALASSPPGLASFFRATDLTTQLIADPDARVTPAQFCVAWAEAIRHTQDPQLALTIADTIPAGAFGLVEYLCRAAPTIGEALRQWVRFLNLLDDAVAVALVTEADHVHLRVVVESEAPAPASHELCFAMVVSTIRRSVAGTFSPSEVSFTHTLRGRAETYGTHFGAPVHWTAHHTQLSFTPEALTTPLQSDDPGLLAVLKRHAEGLAVVDRGPPLTTEVRRVLAAALQSDNAGVSQVAKGLGMTARTLQRRLRDEGTTFQQLRETARRSLANRYLDQDLSLSEIAYLLGFSEPSAFFRAFKRWTGKTPLEVRSTRRGALAMA